MPYEEAVKCVAKIFALKMVHSHIDDKVEYENVQHSIMDALSRIENSIDIIRIKNLKVSLEYFKMAITSIKAKGHICPTTLEYLKSAHNLSIHGYETVSSINDKLIATKITIATAILIYSNDAILLNININAALEKIASNATIRKTVAAECRGDFTFMPGYRRTFVNELKDFVSTVISRQRCRPNIALHDEIEQKSLVDAQLLVLPDEIEQKLPENDIDKKSLVDAQLLVPHKTFRNNFVTNFMFWTRIDVSEKNDLAQCLSIRGNIIRIGKVSCTKIFEYTGKVFNLMETMPGAVWRSEELDKDYLMYYWHNKCVIRRYSDNKQIYFPIIIANENLFSFASRTFGRVYPLTNRKFISAHPSCAPIMVDIDFDAKEGEQVIETELYYNWIKLSGGCVLNDGTIVISGHRDENMTRGHHLHYGYVTVLKRNEEPDKKTEYISNHKIIFDDFALSVKTLTSGHLLVLTTFYIYVVYPKNNPHKCLTGDEQEEWAYKKIEWVSHAGRRTIKLHNDVILLCGEDHFKIIRRSDLDPLEYNVQKVYGTKAPIIDIDVFDDNSICTLDKNGLVMVWH